MEVVFADGSQVTKELKDMMAQIEFSGYVHFIFIARFLNKRANLTLGREVRKFSMTDGKIHLSLNIKSERKAMEKCITYFDKWKVWMMGEEPRTWVVQKKHQLFVAHITYRNLKVAITGFLEYAENLLSKNTSIVFVPFLHSNQSSIEAFFSFMRSLSRDNARDISKALTTSNIQSDVKMASKKSTCYSNDDISNENETLKKAPYDSTTGPKRREEWLNEQIKKRDLEIVPNLGTKVLIFPKDVAAAADNSVRQFMNMVGTEETTESYSSLLLKTHSFRELAKLSSIGPARSWFENVMNGKQEGHFDTLCQQINLKLVNMLAKAGAAKSGAKNDDEKKAVSYQFQIWEMVEKQDLEGLVSETCPIGDRMGVIALIQILDEAIEQKLWAGMIERAELLRKNSNKEKPFHYRDVNSIFGWAVFHARKAKMKERFRRNDDEEKYAELTKEIEFLSAMRMYKSEAALSDHYLENCYHDTMRTSDRGHMTLVREEFFEFGYMLMDNLSSSVTEGKLLSKMEVLRLEKEAILNNTPLWEMWKVSSEKVQCVTEGDRKKMFEYVVKKTVHTKFEDVFKGLRGKLTARGTKQNISGLSFRGEMKGMDRKKTVRTK